jgi:hypothetical protein
MATIIEPTTLAASSNPIDIIDKSTSRMIRNNIGSTFRLKGGTLAAGEYVKLQYMDGATPRDAVINGNGGIILDSDNTVCTIFGNMTDVFVTKSITSAAIGVEVV